MSNEGVGDMAKYQKVSKLYKEIVDALTTQESSHAKNYLNNLSKKIAAKED